MSWGGGGDHHRAAGPDMLRSAGREVCGVRQTNDCQVFVSSSRLLAEKPGVLVLFGTSLLFHVQF